MLAREITNMTILFTNAKIYNTNKRCFEDSELYVRDGIICEPCTTDKTVDLGGANVMPGLIDIHTHGRIGIAADDADISAEKVLTLAKSYAACGTTSFMATFATVEPDWYNNAIDSITVARRSQDEKVCGANILGIHFEGRYLSHAKKGAHAPELLSGLDADELAGFITRMRKGCPDMRFHVTCAPELEGAEKFTRRAVSMDATVGIGHSNATLDECKAALSWGATSFTHLYCAMSAMAHRAPGCVGAGLSSEAYTELICDGFHVAPEVVKITQRTKSPDKLVIITDSIIAAGMPLGVYNMGAMVCDTRDGKVGRLADGVTISGSIIDMFTALKNFTEFTGLSLEEAIPYATKNPAEMVGVYSRVGSLEVGKNADFIVLGDNNETISHVFVRGEKQ